ncbi:MAG: 50S ribosomal protein L18 [Myxococcota bacterium]
MGKASSERRRGRLRRKKHVRRQLAAETRPLLTVYRSSRHIYAQIVDPLSGRTLTSASTRSPGIREGLRSSQDSEAAKKVGESIAKLALEREIKAVAFNRNGFVYTGRVKALADAAREAGLEF